MISLLEGQELNGLINLSGNILPPGMSNKCGGEGSGKKLGIREGVPEEGCHGGRRLSPHPLHCVSGRMTNQTAIKFSLY